MYLDYTTHWRQTQPLKWTNTCRQFPAHRRACRDISTQRRTIFLRFFSTVRKLLQVHLPMTWVSIWLRIVNGETKTKKYTCVTQKVYTALTSSIDSNWQSCTSTRTFRLQGETNTRKNIRLCKDSWKTKKRHTQLSLLLELTWCKHTCIHFFSAKRFYSAQWEQWKALAKGSVREAQKLLVNEFSIFF